MSRMPRGITGLPRAPGHGPLHVPRGTASMQDGGAAERPYIVSDAEWTGWEEPKEGPYLPSSMEDIRAGARDIRTNLLKVAELAGITSKEDVDWASSLEKMYPSAEAWEGRGDAARHLALGWLARNSDKPDLTRFLFNAREYLPGQGGGRGQDLYNHELGFGIEAGTREEAVQAIRRLIEEGEAKVYTPEESRDRYGFQEGGPVEEIPEWMKPDPMADMPTTTWPADLATPWPSPTELPTYTDTRPDLTPIPEPTAWPSPTELPEPTAWPSPTELPDSTFGAPASTYTQHGGDLFGTPPDPATDAKFGGFEGTPDFTVPTFVDPAASEQAHTPITLPPAGQPTPNLFGAVYSPTAAVPTPTPAPNGNGGNGNGGNGNGGNGNGVTPAPTPVVPDEIEVYTGEDYTGWPIKPPESYDPEYLKEWNAKQSDVVKDAFSGNPHFIAATETGEYALTSEGKNAYDYDTLGTLPGGPPTAGQEREPDATPTPTSIPQPGQTGDAKWYIPSREERMEYKFDFLQQPGMSAYSSIMGAGGTQQQAAEAKAAVDSRQKELWADHEKDYGVIYQPPEFDPNVWLATSTGEDQPYTPPAAAASAPPDVAPQYTPTAAPPENFGTLDEYLGSIEPGYTPYVPQVIPEEEPYVPYEPPLDLPTAPVFGGTPAAPTENFVGPTTDFRYSNIPEGVPTTMEDLNTYQNQWDKYLGRMYAGGGPVQHFQTGAGVEAERFAKEKEAGAIPFEDDPDLDAQLSRFLRNPTEPETLSGVLSKEAEEYRRGMEPKPGLISEEGFWNPARNKPGFDIRDITDIVFDPSNPVDYALLPLLAVPPAAAALKLLQTGYKGVKLAVALAKIAKAQQKLPGWALGNPQNKPRLLGSPISGIRTYAQGQAISEIPGIAGGVKEVFFPTPETIEDFFTPPPIPREPEGVTLSDLVTGEYSPVPQRRSGGGISSLSIGI